MNNCSRPRLVCFSAITHIETLRSPKATRMSGIRFCRETINPTMLDCSTGTAGASMSHRGTLPT